MHNVKLTKKKKHSPNKLCMWLGYYTCPWILNDNEKGEHSLRLIKNM